MSKKNIMLCIFTLLLSTVCAGFSTARQETEKFSNPVPGVGTTVEIPAIKEKGTVVVLATGGTIVGQGESGKETGYTSGAISGEDLVNSVEGLADVTNIEVIQICNVVSDDITSAEWITLANAINKLAKEENVDGFVITHGTDTLEETAYFLNLTVKTDKPVVLTGAMRPATALSADGPMNLYQAVCLAESGEAVGKGVMAVFADRIYSARALTKESTYAVTAISAGETGCVGIMRNGTPYFYETSTKRHTLDSEFDVDGLETLPTVNVVYFSVDADPEILKYAAKRSDGIVIAGAGAGAVSKEYLKVIEDLNVPVVISSRIDDGIIIQDDLDCNNAVAANNLPPQKAAILLRLALAEELTDFDTLVRIYAEY